MKSANSWSFRPNNTSFLLPVCILKLQLLVFVSIEFMLVMRIYFYCYDAILQ